MVTIMCCVKLKVGISVCCIVSYWALSVVSDSFVSLGSTLGGIDSQLLLLGVTCPCSCLDGVCHAFIPSCRKRVPTFSHSPYGFSPSSVESVDGHFLWSWPILPQLKHHPASLSYLNTTQTSSPSGLITGLPRQSGLSNGTSK